MAALPSPSQVAGGFTTMYDAYYNMVDPNGFGLVGGMEAARFLKKSGLSDVILSKIWDMSDPSGRGCLDKTGMFVALKLVALVQNGKDLNISNVTMDVPPPKMGDVPLPKPVKPPPPRSSPLITSLPPSAVDWTIKPTEKEKYNKLFDSLQPINDLIPGNKVKNVLMESKLPFDTLGRIWDLADQDKDGMLNRHEFIVAMHLVYKALEKYAIPSSLPPELMEPTKKKLSISLDTTLPNRGVDGIKDEISVTTVNTPPALLVAPNKHNQPPTQNNIPWVVSFEEKEKSDALFIKSDVDKDGFVSGQEIKDVFLQSGVPQPVLAHIWALSDIKQSGKLNNEQFALAMWLVARCLKGVEPPAVLTPEMIPPSLRSLKTVDSLVENNNIRYSNPELDMITKDIEELAKERLALETDIAQKEADLKIKGGEVKSLQSELDTLAATLKQLEVQKGEAQKRLGDLKAQVDKLRTQAAEQAAMVKSQESELNSKKEQLEGLRQEEQTLENQKSESMKKLNSINVNLQDTQICISQAKALITQLQEQSRQMNDAILSCDSAIEGGDASQVSDAALRIKPEFRDMEYNKALMNGFEDMNKTNNFAQDPFKNDPFKNQIAFSNDNFEGFSDSNDGFKTDPFGEPFSSKVEQADPFSAFDVKQENIDTSKEEVNKDPFGCDPFAILHAPTKHDSVPARPASPSPALPPKKSKNPPPRPAPPRPSQPPMNKKNVQDAFDQDTFGSNLGFADFSDFDAKFASKTTTNSAQPSKKLDFTDDPFRDYRYEDPFNITFDDESDEKKNNTTPSDASSFSNSKKFDALDNPDLFGLDRKQSKPIVKPHHFGSVNSKTLAPINSDLFSEDQQLAWAAQESLKLEEDRKKRQLQEQADLELAINLSKAESKKL